MSRAAEGPCPCGIAPITGERAEEPLLGLATTRELIVELAARAEVSEVNGESWPQYRTVDEPKPVPTLSDLEREAREWCRLNASSRASTAEEDVLHAMKLIVRLADALCAAREENERLRSDLEEADELLGDVRDFADEYAKWVEGGPHNPGTYPANDWADLRMIADRRGQP